MTRPGFITQIGNGNVGDCVHHLVDVSRGHNAYEALCEHSHHYEAGGE